MSSLTRQCCCDDVPTGPCGTCDFCDCECTKSITITVSGTYTGALSSEGTPGNNSCGVDVCSPFCSSLASANNCGTCQGVISISGSWTVPFVPATSAGDSVTISGTCSNETATGCRNWAGFVSPASVTFAKNSTQTPCRFVFNSCIPAVYSAYYDPCDAVRSCTWNCQTSGGLECGATWSDPTEMQLVQPVESYVRLQCLTGITPRINIFPYMQNCKHVFRDCDGDAIVPYFAPPIFLGWSDKTKCPSNSTLTYTHPGWISCNVSVT